MPKYSVRIFGYNRVRNSLRALVSAHAQILDPVVREWAQSTRRTLKATKYPPKLANQKYVRTGMLANSFAVERVGVARYRIDNRAQRRGVSYASWVIGDQTGDLRQAQIHQGRWWRMADVIRDELPELRAAIEKGLQNI